jgi:hypothetical protein
MAKPKYDGVVEAVRYSGNGQVQWVRAYLRRGATWSDHVLIDRTTLIEQIKSGKRFVVGKRIPRLAGTFEVSTPITLAQKNGQEYLVTRDVQTERDHLEGVPLI